MQKMLDIMENSAKMGRFFVSAARRCAGCGPAPRGDGPAGRRPNRACLFRRRPGRRPGGPVGAWVRNGPGPAGRSPARGGRQISACAGPAGARAACIPNMPPARPPTLRRGRRRAACSGAAGRQAGADPRRLCGAPEFQAPGGASLRIGFGAPDRRARGHTARRPVQPRRGQGPPWLHGRPRSPSILRGSAPGCALRTCPARCAPGSGRAPPGRRAPRRTC